MRSGDVLGKIAAVGDWGEVRVVAMHHQRRRGDPRQGLHIGLAHGLDDRAGHAGGGGTVACHVPPSAECVVTGHARRDDTQNVNALVDGVLLHCDGSVGVCVADLEPNRVVGRTQGTSRSVDDYQAADPFGIVGRENEPGHRGEVGSQDGHPLAPDRVQHRDGIFGPEFGPIASSDGTRDDSPIPRWSSRITRAKDASLRWKRYIDGSASTASIGMDGPGSTSRSVGPSPRTW